MKKLPRSFYLRPTITVAKDLLGKYFVRRVGQNLLVGKIVEVEAYCGERDPASHAYRGLTERNKVMFEEGGHLYVYFTYGMHFCANVVTREKGVGEAVLIRAVEPVEGVELMTRERGFTADKVDITDLTNGPAKFCEAFGIDRKQNGVDLCGSEIFIAQSRISPSEFRPSCIRRTRSRLDKVETDIPQFHIASSQRIGIRNGKGKKWRFFVKGNRFVSRV